MNCRYSGSPRAGTVSAPSRSQWVPRRMLLRSPAFVKSMMKNPLTKSPRTYRLMKLWPNGNVGANARAWSSSGPTSASAPSAGPRFCRFLTKSDPASLTSLVAVSLNTPSLLSAVVMRGRSLMSTSSAGGILYSAWVITSRCPASVPDSRFSACIDATRLSRCSSRVPTNLSRRVSRSRTSPARPDRAALKLWMMSPNCPSPPALRSTDSDDSVCSVDG